MSFIGTIQSGPNADSYREGAPGIIATVPASGIVNTGTPVRRNYLAVQGQSPEAYPFANTVPGVQMHVAFAPEDATGDYDFNDDSIMFDDLTHPNTQPLGFFDVRVL